MKNYAEEIRSWPVDSAGWSVAPSGGRIKTGSNLVVGKGVNFGDEVIIGDYITIGNDVKIGNCSMIEDRASIGNNVNIGVGCNIGWKFQCGEKVKMGNLVRIGAGVIVGCDVRIGSYSLIGASVRLKSGVRLGKDVSLGNSVILGRDVILSNGSRLGDYVQLPDGESSQRLNEYLRKQLAKTGTKHLFTKWVTPNRRSPYFDSGEVLDYPKGAIIEVKGIISDAPCEEGLHVLQYGHRPEWYGLCTSNHHLIPLTVEVASRDILFAGLPTMTGKLRVRRLKVLN